MYARGRPHSWHRLCCRVENFTGIRHLAILLVLAKALLLFFSSGYGLDSGGRTSCTRAKGIPIRSRSLSAS